MFLKGLSNIKMIATTITFTLIVCFAFRLFIYAPGSMGLFSMGEPIFFLSALLLGPFAGAFVGGVGFAIAVLLLGYPHYVIAALIVNALAGFIVGKLNRHEPSMHRFLSLASILLLIVIFGLVGVTIYSGEIYLGYVKTFFLGEEVLKFGGLYAYGIYVPEWFWIIASIIIAFYILLLDFKKIRSYRWTGFSLLSGCLIIVSGYFLYETFLMPDLFNIEVSAVANIPINVGHSILSATIAFLLNRIMQFKKGEH